MDIKISDYEQLGNFYLGRSYDTKKKELEDELLLYDSKDLVTHGVVLGMTGSGKTGLCLTLLEEAAMDNIPAIVIDPKGDIANLMLTFPNLESKDFRPWINEDDANKKGISPDEFAQKQADLWKNGLAKWGQSSDRIKTLQEKVDINIFTPGSNAGLPISILSSFEAPDFEILDDAELLGDRIESTVTSILALIGVDADPIQSPEHILISSIFNHNWQNEENVSLESLIAQIQSPPFNKIGILDIESFFPQKKRFTLALQINNLLAAPGFSAWLRGEPLDVNNLLHDQNGKPRISIFSIAHLSDSERMFFVSLLLNQTLSWMRSQSGTSSLRALLYMDEIYGYLPPTQNPPSKKPLMTILKQARAFGLGTLLATQNPVDLDYKALSNIGTWFLGRLQTERDINRVIDGLEGAASSQGNSFNRSDIERLLSGLDGRVFLLNNVHDDGPKTFHVRWAMSYLRGPLTRRQIKSIMDPKRKKFSGSSDKKEDISDSEQSKSSSSSENKPPILPTSIKQVYFPAINIPENAQIIYFPALLRSAQVSFNNSKNNIYGKIIVNNITKINKNDQQPQFSDEENPANTNTKLKSLLNTAQNDATFLSDLPGFALNVSNYKNYSKDFTDYLYNNYRLKLFSSKNFETLSQLNESEGDFRARLQLIAHEKRDEIVESIRKKYEKILDRIEIRIEKANLKLEEQKSQSRQAKMNTVLSIGSSILGSFFGGRRSSIATSGRSASRAWKESRDVGIAEKELDKLKEDFEELEVEMLEEIKKTEEQLDPQNEKFSIEEIRPYKKDIKTNDTCLAWLPYYRENEFNVKPAWV